MPEREEVACMELEMETSVLAKEIDGNGSWEIMMT